MTRQYLIPGCGYINETSQKDYFIPGWAYINETIASVPPSSGDIIDGLVMIEIGLTILFGLTPNLYKGLVEDQKNRIKR